MKILSSLFIFQHLNYLLQCLEIAGVNLHVEDIALRVNEFVSREGVDLQIALYG